MTRQKAIFSITALALVLSFPIMLASQNKQETRSKASASFLTMPSDNQQKHSFDKPLEPGEPAVDTHVIKIDIQNGVFVPATITTKVGISIAWENKDEQPHEVIGDGGFHIGPFKKGQKITGISYQKPGTYFYSLKKSPSVKGTIVVTN